MIVVTSRAGAYHPAFGTVAGNAGSFVGQENVRRLCALERLTMTGLAIHGDMRGVIEPGMDIPAIGDYRLGDDGFVRRGRLDLVAVGATWKQGALGRRRRCGNAKIDGSLVREEYIPLQIGSLADALADAQHVLIDKGRDWG